MAENATPNSPQSHINCHCTLSLNENADFVFVPRHKITITTIIMYLNDCDTGTSLLTDHDKQ